MSVTTGGIEGTAMSGYPAVSGDGRFVAFWSMAALVPDDTNGMGDVYLRDRDTDADGIFDEHGAVATARVSVADDESQGNGGSGHPDVSDDGRYVAFDSWATNLVTNDSNAKGDVFVRDRVAGTTGRVSVGVFGQGNGDSTEPAMSSDGQTVGFQSFASNLAWWDTNSTSDVFVRSGGTTVRASLTDAEGQYNVNAADPSISADGSRVAFEVGTGVFVRDISAGSTTQASLTDAEAQPNNQSSEPSISADGTRVAFRSLASNLVAGDGNGAWDVFVRNLSFGTTRRVSVSSGGTESNAASGAPSISGDGLRVAFESQASNLVSGDLNGARDVFVRYG
jgi:Tol biopolymer transport system component